MAAGDTISGFVFASGTLTYSFDAQAGAEYALFLEATSGGGVIHVKDSTSGGLLTVVSDAAGGPGLEAQVSGNFSRPGILLIQMFGLTSDTTRFRFYIYTVNRAPESRNARFALGDTVTGESINPIPDVDDFYSAGSIGQYLAGWVEPLAPGAYSPLSLYVTDTVSHVTTLISAVGGAPAHPLFSMGPLAVTADYRFTVLAPRSGVPYTGPYRFHAYEINPAPESTPGALAANSVVSEALDVGGDIDDFTFPATAGAEFNLFLQSTVPYPLGAVLQSPIPGVGASVTATAGDTGMFANATGRFRVPADTTYSIRVRGWNRSDAVGGYRLYLYPINRTPESLSAVVTPGDTISGESIDLPGDIDEFTFSGAAGKQFNIFVQKSVQGFQGVTMTLRDPDSVIVASAQSNQPATDLLLQATGRFTLLKTGTYRLTFDGGPGPYRFFIYPVNPQPETHGAAIAFRDSIENESIDVPGDVDEYTFSTPESSSVTLYWDASAITYGVGVSVVRAGTGEQIPIDGYYTNFNVGPGSYILRVESSPYSGGGVGSYLLWMYPWKPTPESMSENIAIGDTLESEQLDPPGDVDVFYFDGIKGQHVNFAFQGTSAPTSNGGYTALLYQPASIMGWVSTPTSSPSLGSHQTTRLDLPATGRYSIRIQGGSSPTQRIEHGPYRFALTAVDTMPEQAGTALVPGDSVTTESIDMRGDWDQFTVTATPGEDLGLVFTSSGTGYYPWILASNPATGDSLARTVGQFTRFAGPFRVPSGGQARVAVYEPAWRFYECYDATCGNMFGFTGSYRFNVIRVNRAPETASATYVLGDTARDAIDVGDVDEYNASATAGAFLTAYIRVTAPPVPSGSGLTLEIINPVTGDTLAGKGWQVYGQAQLVPVGSFSVPVGGNFLIRVRGSGTFGDDIITAPYEMVVKP